VCDDLQACFARRYEVNHFFCSQIWKSSSASHQTAFISYALAAQPIHRSPNGKGTRGFEFTAGTLDAIVKHLVMHCCTWRVARGYKMQYSAHVATLKEAVCSRSEVEVDKRSF